MARPTSPKLLLLLLVAFSTNIQVSKGDNNIRRQEHVDQTTRRVEEEFEDNSIVGGTSAAAGEFPFFVQFAGRVLCGGSLISPNRVLTAAHCVEGLGPPEAVYIGSTLRDEGQYVKVECAVVHPDYKTPFITVVNDVAILKLSEDVVLDNGAAFVELNQDMDYPEGITNADFTVIGYGIRMPSSKVASDTLQQLTTNYVPTEACHESYSDIVVRPKAHICADVKFRGDCQGDSGGPVVARSSSGAYVQVGIVSFGFGGCASEYPDIYARVANYYDFIQEQIEDDTCPSPNILNIGEGPVVGFMKMSVGFVGLLMGVTKDRIVNFLSP